MGTGGGGAGRRALAGLAVEPVMDAGSLRNAIELLLLVTVTLIGIGRWLERENTSARVAALERWRADVDLALKLRDASTETISRDVASLSKRHHDQTVPWQTTTDKRLNHAERQLDVHEQRIDRAEQDIDGLRRQERR